jgi:MoCo/4Fe-4S cofactor protein with predicted Tat translocation signal
MANDKKYWKSLEDLNNSPSIIKKAQNEFSEEIPLEAFLGNSNLANGGTPRRDFLKFLGFSITAATLAACETPVRRTVPYLIKPEEVTPGISNWYASTFDDGHDYCSVLVKTREGRPIKIEGNQSSSFTGGATNARVQASVLSLYDNARLTGPLKGGSAVSWKDADAAITAALNETAQSGGAIRILSSTVTSPSLNKLIAEFIAKYPGAKHVTYDAVSYHGIRKAHQNTFGSAIIPAFDFTKANVIVGIGADFLANWISPIQISRQYGIARKISAEKKDMARHYQFESILSLTGSNADYRVGAKPSQLGLSVLNLYNEIAKLAGVSALSSKALPFDKTIQSAAKDLWANKGKSIVVCGLNDTTVQEVVIGINQLLGNYGSTLDAANPLNLRQGNDEETLELVADMKAGKVGALIMLNTNPAYTMPASAGFAEALKKVKLSVSMSDRNDETASLCSYVCPDHHYLESWGDSSPQAGLVSLIQPTINPLFSTRAAGDSFLKWMGQSGTYQDYISSNWKNSIYPRTSAGTSFDDFWVQSLHDGVISLNNTGSAPSYNSKDLSAAAADINKNAVSGEWEITLYEKTGIGNGNQSNNPWLQEMPDPISKVCWDNYVTMSPKQMQSLGFRIIQEKEETFDVVELTVNGVTVKAPVFPQPGQPEGTIGLALGYGRTAAGKAADNLGSNGYSLLSVNDGSLNYMSSKVSLKDSEEDYILASTQTHHTLMGRHMVKEATLSEYQKDSKAGNPQELLTYSDGHNHKKVKPEELNLWVTDKHPGHPKPNHFWNMAIDLNSCIGCGNCVVSCNAENNVAVVGKTEVLRSREMHWIRIDRYYSSDTTKADKDELGLIGMYRAMEIPSDNPKVVFQPVMCQHCSQAPCETVCPVLATTHSAEGLNHMTYNRCVGTKYCANNCPYKVRRFNWFKYFDNNEFDFNMNNDLGKMVLNPDVTVRSRGVMEKCSMCIQRIQEGKLTAKKEGRRIKDGEFTTACAQSCPTNAITFGDINDETSLVNKMKKDDRAYQMLEELDVKPSVHYLVKIRNNEETSHSHA